MKTYSQPEDFGFRDLPRAIWFFLAKDQRKYIFFTALLLLVLFYDMVPPYLIGRVANFLVNYQAGDSLAPIYWDIGLLVVSFNCVAIVRLSSKRVLGKISLSARYRAKVWGFERLLDFSLAWHQTESTGNKAQRILTGSEAIREWIGDVVNNVFPALTAFIGTLIACMFLHWTFVFFFAYYLGGLLLIERYFDTRISKISDDINRSIENASGTFIESASNILAVKALGAAGGMVGSVTQREELARKLSYKRLRLGNSKWMCFMLHTGLAWGIFIAAIAWMSIHGLMAVGFVLTYSTYFNRMREAATQFTDQIQTMIERKSNLGRMMPVFWSNNSLEQGSAEFPEHWNAIQAVDARFSYGEASDLGPFNFAIRRGEKIGVAGRSGSGKSTVIKLMLGLYHLRSGSLKIDEAAISDIRHEALTSHTAVVLQETELFNFSLRDNITMTREVSPQLLAQAIHIACLEELAARLPDGLDTSVGEKGHALSGGERQRVGIARAICRDAPIMLLDEATSALDSETEQRVTDNLMGAYGRDKTMIIVAHRISTLKDVDRVLVFEQGQIVEEGRYGDLIADGNTRFGAMHAVQAG